MLGVLCHERQYHVPLDLVHLPFMLLLRLNTGMAQVRISLICSSCVICSPSQQDHTESRPGRSRMRERRPTV